GVGISILSYRGWVRVGMTVDAALVPSRSKAQSLIDAVGEEVTLLLDVLAQPPPSPVHHRRYANHESQAQQCEEEDDLRLVVSHTADNENKIHMQSYAEPNYTDSEENQDLLVKDLDMKLRILQLNGPCMKSISSIASEFSNDLCVDRLMSLSGSKNFSTGELVFSPL
ncbi:unnamed protein product, partial [Meganyctiphanes norvegica]